MRIYASEWQRRQQLNRESRQNRNRIITMLVCLLIVGVVQAW